MGRQLSASQPGHRVVRGRSGKRLRLAWSRINRALGIILQRIQREEKVAVRGQFAGSAPRPLAWNRT